MGVWQALKLFSTNANYANLGISKGAARELTIAIGRGDPGAVQHDLNLAHTVNTLTSLLYFAAMGGAGLWIGCTSSGAWARTWAIGLTVVGGLAVVQRYVTFQVTLLRSKQDFASTSQLSILEGVLTLALGSGHDGSGACGVSTPAPWRCSALDLVRPLPRRIAAGVGLGNPRNPPPHRHRQPDAPGRRRFHAIPLDGQADDPRLSERSRVPTGLLLAGLDGCRPALRRRQHALDRDRTAAGRTLRILGEPPRRGPPTIRSSELLAAAIALPAALAMVAVPPLLGTLLPDYRTGLVPMLWLIPGVIALTLALVPAQYLMAVDRQRWSLIAVLLATGIAAGAIYAALRGGCGLQGVAIATSGSYLAYFALVAVPLWIELDRPGRLRYLGMHALAVVPTRGRCGMGGVPAAHGRLGPPRRRSPRSAW